MHRMLGQQRTHAQCSAGGLLARASTLGFAMLVVPQAYRTVQGVPCQRRSLSKLCGQMRRPICALLCSEARTATLTVEGPCMPACNSLQCSCSWHTLAVMSEQVWWLRGMSTVHAACTSRMLPANL